MKITAKTLFGLVGTTALLVGAQTSAQSANLPDAVKKLIPAAIQEGIHAARNIERLARNQPTRSFAYKDKGTLATIGRAAAVAQFKRIRFSGFLAWIAWLAIHIFFLIGFRNRLWVLSGWAWSYVTFQRGARLITGRHRYQALPRLSDDHR